ncbi:type VI secretion system protein TssA [Photobacterium leiognathi]|uniref:type VI secretion system protein TssA n=1 Tax=Photobacterium leiognathi TaxID=553611 RepID=UPI003DA05080
MSKVNIRELIVTPITIENPIGERLIDEPLLNFIDSQMIKVGSLSHGEVQWDNIENSVISLLAKKTKDIKLLTVLMQCLQHKTTPERFVLSLGVLVDFISNFWLECYPIPGERGVIHRKKFFNQICQRTYIAVSKLDGNEFDDELKKTLEDLLKELEYLAGTLALPVDIIHDIRNRLDYKLAQVKRSEQKQSKPLVTMSTEEILVLSSQTESDVQQATLPTLFPRIEVDNSSERAFKQSLLKTVKFLSEFGSDGIKLSIRIRRFAMWYSIHTLPDANKNKETQLMFVPLDCINDYEESLQRSPDIALWNRVEESLTKSPYWFDGHFLSYRIALSLGEDTWASIIKDELQCFIERLPALLTYSFKGQVPFANEATIMWLNSDNKGKTTEICQIGSWNDKREEALKRAHEEGIESSLSMLDKGLSQSIEPRDAFYWRLLSAEVMKAYSLPSMATVQYQMLYHQINEMSVTEWEPSLITQIKNNIIE